MKVYNKLVRDKIPDIIKKDNGEPITRILNDEEYLLELNKKLKEELDEYLEEGSIEELADMAEVMRAIIELKKITFEDFEEVRLIKVKKRGAFKERIFLERED
ncbi:MAG: nucleoside triphosphate pyrophosphohydrolase [Bacilli bacterium]|nr:nucleoside triphosphate pyrophosphohydrolase [Bacilli bacterium]MDD4809345.1 nucleoside triphosphate pyrophosphohydrolase [Bacilli bacterium]